MRVSESFEDDTTRVSSETFEDENPKSRASVVTKQMEWRRCCMVALHFLCQSPGRSLSFVFFLAYLTNPLLRHHYVAFSKPVEALHAFIGEESLFYEQCVEQSFQHLQEEIDQVAEREGNNVIEHRNFNQDLLDQAVTTTGKCAISGAKAQEALYQWTNNQDDQPLVFLNTTLCSQQDQDYIAASLGQDFQALESEVASIVNEYVRSSRASFDRVRDYTDRRSAYDYNYFLRDRIEPALALLEQFSDLHSLQFDGHPQELVDQLKASLERMREALRRAQNRIAILQARVEEFYDALLQFTDRYDSLFLQMKMILNFSLPWIPTKSPKFPGGPTVQIPEYFKYSNVPLSIDLHPPSFEVPTFSVPLPDFDLMLNDFSKDALQLIVDLVETLEEEATQILQSTTKAILQQIREKLVLEDYNPPKYQGSQSDITSVDEEAVYLDELGDATEKNTLIALGKVPGLSNLSAHKGLLSDLPDIDTGNHTFSGDIKNFSFLDISGFKVNLPPWFLYFEDLFVFLFAWKVWIDILYGALRGWSLHLRYQKSATGEQQSIESVDDGSDEDSGWLERIGNKLYLFARIPTFIWPIVGMLAVVYFGGLAQQFWGEWHTHVYERCVISENGTALANHATVPWLINVAGAAGNARHRKGELDCRQRQRLVCNKMFADSDISYRNDVAALLNLQNRHNQSIDFILRLERCIDTEELDSHFGEACCGLEGYGLGCFVEPQSRPFPCPIDELVHPPAAFRPIGTYASEPACQTNSFQWELKDSRFNCQALEDSCSGTPCTGVDNNLIRSMAIEADCLVNLLGIRYSLCFFVVLFHFIALNLIATLFVTGLTKVCWKKLRPDRFSFITQTNENGEFIIEGSMNREQREEKAKTASWWLVFQGKAMIFFSLAFSVGYVICIIYFPRAHEIRIFSERESV